eukprot:TRINITY_DN76919_c0_g1_i1.p1 TRINITY_DN76919_c0_g1~~TRINITY_DN76919_c0_g1_i1.p1  ORF type:complete len:179 (-),score=1.67 TRINITY_DN76919_c0_g1_i1:112-648(-)
MADSSPAPAGQQQRVGCFSCSQGVVSTLIRCAAILGLLGTGFVGVWCMITCDIKELKLRLVMVYLILFSVCGIFVEFSLFGVMAKIQFLTSWVGRAVFYIFLGTLCLGSGIPGWVIGPYMCAIGVLIIVARVKWPTLLPDAPGVAVKNRSAASATSQRYNDIELQQGVGPAAEAVELN